MVHIETIFCRDLHHHFPPTFLMFLFLRANILGKSTFHSLLLPALTSSPFNLLVMRAQLLRRKCEGPIQFCFRLISASPSLEPTQLSWDLRVSSNRGNPLSQMRQVSNSFWKTKSNPQTHPFKQKLLDYFGFHIER